MSDWLAERAGEDYCYVTTIGRRTGRPHTIEIWFVVHDGVIYVFSQNRDGADWVRNLEVNPAVQVRVGPETHAGQARIVDAQAEVTLDAAVRRLLAAKYEGWDEGQPLSSWLRAALPVAIITEP